MTDIACCGNSLEQGGEGSFLSASVFIYKVFQSDLWSTKS